MMNPNAARIAFEIPGAALYLGEKVKGLTCPTRFVGAEARYYRDQYD